MVLGPCDLPRDAMCWTSYPAGEEKKSFMKKRKAADVALVMAEPGTSRDQWMTN